MDEYQALEYLREKFSESVCVQKILWHHQGPRWKKPKVATEYRMSVFVDAGCITALGDSVDEALINLYVAVKDHKKEVNDESKAENTREP